jgi:hypothetical protein
MMPKRFSILLLLLLLADLAYSFFQHYHAALDGDMAAIILPADRYQQVLKDPLGLNVLLHHSIYSAPNRAFTHWPMSVYFKTAPFIFQYMVSPLKSVYMACGFMKTCTQAALIYVLAVYISGQYRLLNRDLLVAAVLVTPLFQANGFTWKMGIIDPSITYTFFYALGMLYVLLFFLPFFLSEFYGRSVKLTKATTVLLSLLSLVMALGGPLNTAVVILVCALLVAAKWWSEMRRNTTLPLLTRAVIACRQIPRPMVLLFVPAVAFSVYSFYVGKNNLENFWISIPLSERYARLPKGFIDIFTSKGPGLLLLMVGVNIALLWGRRREPQVQKIWKLLLFAGVFPLAYILLLPLGGYRPYRPLIIRRDTIMPVMLLLFIFYGVTTMYLLKNIGARHSKMYVGVLTAMLLVFTVADAPNRGNNYCEQEAIKHLAASEGKVILLQEQCTVMAWDKITNYNDSRLNAILLHYWHVTKEDKLYYQK